MVDINRTHEPQDVLEQGLKAALAGNSELLGSINWELDEVDVDGITTLSFWPSELQRHALRFRAEVHMRHALALLATANNYDDSEIFVEAVTETGEVYVHPHWREVLQIATMTEDEILGCEDIEIPFNAELF